MERSFWINLFTSQSWVEFMDLGSSVTGFTKRKWKLVQKMSSGDVLLCFNRDKSGFIGALETIGAPYQDNGPLFKDEFLPCRVNTKPIIVVSSEEVVNPVSLQDRLSIFHNLANPNMWTDFFRNSPAEFDAYDGEIVLNALLEIEKSKSGESSDKSGLGSYKTDFGLVTIPPSGIDYSVSPSIPMIKTAYLLLTIGQDRGHCVWSSARYRGRPIENDEIPKFELMISKMPDSMDGATALIAEEVCVMWFDDNTPVAAFVLESGETLLQSLLWLSDLKTLMPNLGCYLTCPGDLEAMLVAQLNRPTLVRANCKDNDSMRMLTFSSARNVFDDGRILEEDILNNVSKPLKAGVLDK